MPKKIKKRIEEIGYRKSLGSFREARTHKARIIKKAIKVQYRIETENACDSPANM